jgi:hypothetical protein
MPSILPFTSKKKTGEKKADARFMQNPTAHIPFAYVQQNTTNRTGKKVEKPSLPISPSEAETRPSREGRSMLGMFGTKMWMGRKDKKGTSFALKRPWFMVSCALVRNREASRTRMECIGDDGTIVCWR